LFTMTNDSHVIEGGKFDKPLVLQGEIDAEPERYIAEKPYELTKFEFSVMRRRINSEFWSTLIAGATAGVAIPIIGKVLSALLEKKTATFETWEIWSVIFGAIVSIVFKISKSKDDKEKLQLEAVIDGHFANSKPRRVHLTNNKGSM